MKPNNPKVVDLVLLPGLHGTDSLFSDLKDQLIIAAEGSGLDLNFISINYPNDIGQEYTDLINWICSEVNFIKPNSASTVILAESFSSPLAIMLADRYPNIIDAIVIAGGFCSSPILSETATAALSLIPLRPLFMLRPPKSAIRHYLTGDDADPAFVKTVQRAISATPSRVISDRVRAVLDLDESSCPTISQTPALLLQSEDDNILPWEAQNALVNHLSHAQAHWLKSPHFILQRHPGTSARLIIPFLKSILKQ